MNKLDLSIKNILKILRAFSKKYDTSSLGELGRGAGKGGGGGGPIREAGGSFGKIGAAREEEYFYQKQRRLLGELKEKLLEENTLREQQIQIHKDAIEENIKLAEDIKDQIENTNECNRK